MIIHLVRHGQTRVGDDGLYVPNAGLTELGRRQANQVANHMVKLNPRASFSSNLPRAIETAECFSRLSGQTIHQIPNLAELDTGNIWAAPESIKSRIRNGGYGVDYKSMGGESVDEFSARIRVGLDQLLEASAALEARSIAAFLHEGVIVAILDHLEDFETFNIGRREPMPNGAMITIDPGSKGPHYAGFWETGHLDE